MIQPTLHTTTPSPSDALAPEQVLQEVFGYKSFRSYQKEIITRVASGRDALLVMPTGGGKSLCFQIPALLRQGTAIVVSPLIALMQDQVEALRQVGVRAACWNSTLDLEQQREVRREMLAGHYDLLYVAPERLMTPVFLRMLERVQLSLFAVDEVHCIARWGHDFRPEYLQLTELRRRFPAVPCVALTATADQPTLQEIQESLCLQKEDVFVTGFDRPNLRYTCGLKNNAKLQLLQFIRTHHPEDAGIVYCLSRKRVDSTAAWLQGQGYDALPYHAGMTTQEREHNQRRFLLEEGVIVVATVAFGMGIDKPNVRYVAHLDLPKTIEAYYQEVGRAGRDGLPASAWMVYGLSDVVLRRKMIESSTAEAAHKQVELHKLLALLGYAEAAECRRKVLLAYFGELREENCGNCDNCLRPVKTWDATEAARKVMSCIYRSGQSYGAGHVIDILLGKPSKKVLSQRHDQLSTYGIGRNLSATMWRSVIRQLIAANMICVDQEGHGCLQLTGLSRPLLRGEQSIMMRKDAERPPTRRKGLRGRDEETVAAFRRFRQEPSRTMGIGDRALYRSLRKLRKELAEEQEIPPYLVFPDHTLSAMARQRPQNLKEFRRLSGVGAAKFARYGEVFLAKIREFEETMAS